MGKQALIYTLSHPETKEIRYVGWTSTTLKQRLSSHLSDARRLKDNNHKNNWIRKLLKRDLLPTIALLENVSFDRHVERERHWIRFFGRQSLVNSTDGGEGSPGYVPTPEVREKWSKSRIGNTNSLGYKHTPETKAKISRALLGNTYCVGRKLTEEHKEKISKAGKGRKVSPETREKLSKVNSGDKHYLWGKSPSPETREKMSKSRKGNTYCLGFKHTSETKKNLVDARTGRKRGVGTSIYIGVCWNKARNNWKSQITLNKKAKHLGSFDSEVQAAQTHDLHSIIIYDGKYPINFPNLKQKYKKLIKQGITKITEELK